MLYLICGLPGVGKSTVSKEIEKLTGAVLLRTDEIRKLIFKTPEYTKEEKEKVYDALFRTAESLLRLGKDVILDATFYKESLRKEALSFVKKAGAPYKIVEVVCDEKLMPVIMKKRKREFSDADYDVYRKVKAQWEPVSEEHEVVDTTTKEWKKRVKEIAGSK
jgi:predicted kinase